MPRPDRAELLREPEKYGVTELCQFAKELLWYHGEDPADLGRATVTWYTPYAALRLYSTRLDEDGSAFSLHVKDKQRVNFARFYLFNSNDQNIRTYDGDMTPLPPTGFPTPTTRVMEYLRSNPFEDVYEPNNSKQTDQEFERILAGIAVDSTIEIGLVDVDQIAAQLSTMRGYEQLNTAREDTLTFGLHIEGKDYQYSRSSERVQLEINERVRHARKALATRALPAPKCKEQCE